MCDIWSCGVILYILLTGNPPFNGENDAEIIKNVERGRVNYKCDGLKFISKEAISFIKKLLTYNPNHRIRAIKALEDPWILKATKSQTNIDNTQTNNILQKLKNFRVISFSYHRQNPLWLKLL